MSNMCVFELLYMQVSKYEKRTKMKPKPEKRAREMDISQRPEPGMLNGQKRSSKLQECLRLVPE